MLHVVVPTHVLEPSEISQVVAEIVAVGATQLSDLTCVKRLFGEPFTSIACRYKLCEPVPRYDEGNVQSKP
jgi:hypothetical protein